VSTVDALFGDGGWLSLLSRATGIVIVGDGRKDRKSLIGRTKQVVGSHQSVPRGDAVSLTVGVGSGDVPDEEDKGKRHSNGAVIMEGGKEGIGR